MQFKNHIRANLRGKIRNGYHQSLIINPPKLNRENEIRILRQKVQFISHKLELIKKRAEIQTTKSDEEIVALVDQEECAGCGICYDVCPEGAISIDLTARIDSGKCTACLECVNRCPRGAIAIKYQSD